MKNQLKNLKNNRKAQINLNSTELRHTTFHARSPARSLRERSDIRPATGQAH